MKKFLTRKVQRKTSQHHKMLMFRWKYIGEKTSVICKKKKKIVWFSRL